MIKKSIPVPFVVSLSNHERNTSQLLTIRQACCEPVEQLRANGFYQGMSDTGREALSTKNAIDPKKSKHHPIYLKLH